MKLLKQTYSAAMLAINAIPTLLGKSLIALSVDSYSKKDINDPDFDPNAIKFAVWVIKEEQGENTVEQNIYCYYIAINEQGRWCIRECDQTDFTEVNFISCPLHFLNKVNLTSYNPLWVKAVRDYHSDKLKKIQGAI